MLANAFLTHAAAAGTGAVRRAVGVALGAVADVLREQNVREVVDAVSEADDHSGARHQIVPLGKPFSLATEVDRMHQDGESNRGEGSRIAGNRANASLAGLPTSREPRAVWIHAAVNAGTPNYAVQGALSVAGRAPGRSS